MLLLCPYFLSLTSPWTGCELHNHHTDFSLYHNSQTTTCSVGTGENVWAVKSATVLHESPIKLTSPSFFNTLAALLVHFSSSTLHNCAHTRIFIWPTVIAWLYCLFLTIGVCTETTGLSVHSIAASPINEMSKEFLLFSQHKKTYQTVRNLQGNWYFFSSRLNYIRGELHTSDQT